jgi:hypothetical protein
MTLMIGATVKRGYGVATKNLKFQMPHLIWHFPELKNIHTATINILLDRALHVSKYDRTTLPLPWWDVDTFREGFWHIERFSIFPIKFEYPFNAASKDAWLFVSHNSSYASDPLRFEVVTEKIDGLAIEQRRKIYVEETDHINVGNA